MNLYIWISISSLPIFSLFVFIQLRSPWQSKDLLRLKPPLNEAAIQENSLLENDCKFPIIEPNEQNLVPYVEHVRSLQCVKQMPNFAFLDDDGYLLFQKDLDQLNKAKTLEIKCYYYGLTGALAPGKTVIQRLPNETLLKRGRFFKVQNDQFVVECFNETANAKLDRMPLLNDTLIYRRAFATFSDKFPEANVQTDKKNLRKKLRDFDYADPESPSLSILVLDSLSRNQFMRHMTKSVEFMKKMGFLFFEGYTKVGDNSNVNLLPILAGKSTLPQVGGHGYEILSPETPVDLEKIEFLWTIMKKRRCVTLFNDDIGDRNRGLFHYGKLFKGFKKPPTHYYFRPYQLHNLKYQPSQFCTPTGQTPVKSYMRLWENFSTKFKDYCHFSFNFLTMLSHDNPNFIETVDEQLRISLERLFVSGAFNNTVFVIMGDHGQRIGAIQYSYAGRIEERAPLFSIRLPDQFVAKYPKQFQILKINTKRLTSNYDMHQTLKDIATGKFRSGRPYDQQEGRGRSLFEEEIETSRNCTEAGIPPNFCLCMEKQKISRMNRTSKEYANVMKLIQSELRNHSCIEKNSFAFDDENLEVYAINQMVRQGIRAVESWPKFAKTRAALEILYFDVPISVKAEIPLNNTKIQQRVQILFRIKHYTAKETYYIADEPWILNTNSTYVCHRFLKNLCSACFE